jgi:glucokinase
VAGAERIAADAGTATVHEAIAAAEAGDEAACAAIERAAGAIGRVIAGAVVLLWPERVVVGGGVASAGDTLLDPIRAEVRRRACAAPVDRIDVVPAELGPFAGAVGAALWGADGSAA